MKFGVTDKLFSDGKEMRAAFCETMIKLAKEAVQRGLSVRQVEAAVRGASKKPTKRSAPSIYAESLSHELTGELGRRVRIVEGRKRAA